MLGNLTYRNPTRVHFGPDALDQLADELAQSGPTVMLAYGGSVIGYAKGVPVSMTPPATSASSTSPARTTTLATTWPRAS